MKRFIVAEFWFIAKYALAGIFGGIGAIWRGGALVSLKPCGAEQATGLHRFTRPSANSSKDSGALQN